MANVSDEDLQSYLTEEVAHVVQFVRYPCHTQAVERGIKLVTEASAAVCSQKNRDGFFRNRLALRAKMEVFNTKSQYTV